MPDLTSDRKDCGYGVRGGCRGDGALKFHAWFQVVNSQLFSINCSLGALRDVLKMSDRAIFHSHDQIVALQRENLATINPNYFATLTWLYTLCCLYLCRVQSKNNTNGF